MQGQDVPAQTHQSNTAFNLPDRTATSPSVELQKTPLDETTDGYPRGRLRNIPALKTTEIGMLDLEKKINMMPLDHDEVAQAQAMTQSSTHTI